MSRDKKLTCTHKRVHCGKRTTIIHKERGKGGFMFKYIPNNHVHYNNMFSMYKIMKK